MRGSADAALFVFPPLLQGETSFASGALPGTPAVTSRGHRARAPGKLGGPAGPDSSSEPRRSALSRTRTPRAKYPPTSSPTAPQACYPCPPSLLPKHPPHLLPECPHLLSQYLSNLIPKYPPSYYLCPPSLSIPPPNVPQPPTRVSPKPAIRVPSLLPDHPHLLYLPPPTRVFPQPPILVSSPRPTQVAPQPPTRVP